MATAWDETQTDNIDLASQRLRATMTAARLHFNWFGVRKSLNSSQKDQAANSFGAEAKFLSAGKKLLDTSHPAYKAVTAIRGRAVAYWKAVSLPYPEPGIRLVRRDEIEGFSQKLAIFGEELEEAVRELNQQYDELRLSARERLGDLFEPGDYPATLLGLFAIEYDFPSVEPPAYLQQLNPQLYQQQCQRVQARFEEAVQLAELAFTEEFSNLVSHLTDRLSGHEDGRPKIFRDTAIGNLQEFFERFRSLNISSNQQLEELVESCQQIVSGIAPQQLRTNGGLRQQVATQLSSVQSVLDGLLIDRPRRSILRSPKPA